MSGGSNILLTGQRGISGRSHDFCLPFPARQDYARAPFEFCQDQLCVDLDPEQRECIESVRDNAQTAWRSGHGPGKSFIAACVILWFIYCHTPSLVLATAPTRAQLYDVLWLELERRRQASLIADDFEWQATSLRVRGREHHQMALARTSNNPQALAGRRLRHLLLLVDEASAVKDEIFIPAESALTTEHSRMLLLGNPIRRAGTFFNAFHRDAAEFHAIHVDCENNPRVPQSYVEKIARRYGIDSDIYRVRVKGEFPVGDPGTFITFQKVAAAQMREAPETGPWVLAVDVAGMGDDRSTFVAGRGLRVMDDATRGAELEFYQRLEEPELVARILNKVRRLHKGQTLPVTVVIDGGGLGWGPAGQLRHAAEQEPGLLTVVEQQFGGAGIGEYANFGSYMWGRARDLIDLMELPQGTGDDLAAQLADEISTRKYELKGNGLIAAQPKQDHKQEHDGLSPDWADAFVLFCSVYGQEALLPAVRIRSTVNKNA